MAVNLTAASTDKIAITNPQTFGSGTEFTYLMWFRRNGALGNSQGVSKGTTADVFVYTGAIGYFSNVGRTSTLSERRTTQDMLPLNTWAFVGVTYSESDDTRMWTGNLTSTAVEPTYTGNTVGAGATSANSGDLWLVNRSAASALAVAGDLAVAAWFNRKLTQAEIVDFQFNPRNLPGCQFLYFPHDIATITDYSGNARNGTGTGLVVADHVPLSNPFAPASGGVAVSPSSVSTTVAPGALSLALSVAAATVATGAAIAATVASLALSVPAASVTAVQDVSTTPSVQAVTLSIPPPTVSGSALVTAGVQGVTLSIPAPLVTAVQNASSSPAAQSLTLSVQTTTATGGANAAPAVQTLTLGIPAATAVVQSPAATPANKAMYGGFAYGQVPFGGSLGAPTGNVTASPGVLSLPLSLQAPSVTAIQNVTTTPAVQGVALSLQTPTATTGANTAAGVQGLTLSLQPATVTGIGSVTVSAGVQALTLAAPAPSVATGVTVQASVTSASLTTAAPTILLGATITPSPQSLTLSVPAVQITGIDPYQDKYSERGTSSSDKYTNRGSSYSGKYSTRSSSWSDKYS